jgi:hypothetical protein
MQAIIKNGLGNNKIESQQLFEDETEVFKPPSVDITYRDSRVIIYTPQNTLSDAGPLQFQILGFRNDFIDVSKTKMLFHLQVFKDENTVLTATDVVAPVNGIGNAMWKNIAVDIKGQTIPELTTIYSNYKNHIETCTMFGSDAMNSHLETRFWFKGETFTEFTNTGSNESFKKRYAKCKESKIFEVMDTPSCDFCSITKLIPPDTPLTFEFTRAPDELVLNCDSTLATGTTVKTYPKYRLHIVKAELHVTYVTLHQDVARAILAEWHKEPMKFPMTKTSIVTQSHAKGLTQLTWTQAFTGSLPKQILIGLIPSKQWTGQYDKHCFRFSHHNVEHFCIRKNGTQIPATAYALDFTDKKEKYIRLYNDFNQSIGHGSGDWGNEITMNAYKNNYFLMAINLNLDCTGFHKHADEIGTIEIDVRLRSELDEPTLEFACAYSDGLIYLDQWRNVSSTFSITN